MSAVEVASSPAKDDSMLLLGYCHNNQMVPRMAGSVIPVRVLGFDSIASMKLRIQTCKGFVVKKQKLVYGGRELARSDTAIKNYGIEGGNVLHLVLKLSYLLDVC